MPSFDLISKVDMSELKNCIEMVRKILGGRYDFKGSLASIELLEESLELRGEDDYKLKTLLDLLHEQMGKRKLGLNNLQAEKPVASGKNMLKQKIVIRQGIDKEQAKIITKFVKNSGMKVTASILDEKVRLEAKKIDDLQAVFMQLRNHPEVTLDLRMDNMKNK